MINSGVTQVPIFYFVQTHFENFWAHCILNAKCIRGSRTLFCGHFPDTMTYTYRDCICREINYAGGWLTLSRIPIALT